MAEARKIGKEEETEKGRGFRFKGGRELWRRRGRWGNREG
jgi:hypothetical protein